MDLNTVWFILVTVLFIGFFLLEGFDYGVGILLPFLGKDDSDRRVIINTIGPFWDGNEVWLITAGGAMFAAFPEWYATMFSGFYLALAADAAGPDRAGRGFRVPQQGQAPAWRSLWDWMIFVGSFVPALLWGVAFGNIIRGVPIDADMQYVGGFLNLLNPYALLGGLASSVGLYPARRHLPEPEDQGGARGAGSQGCRPSLAARRWCWSWSLSLPPTLPPTCLPAWASTPGRYPWARAWPCWPRAGSSGSGDHGWAFVMTSLTIALSSHDRGHRACTRA